jgi:hypothetical protein
LPLLFVGYMPGTEVRLELTHRLSAARSTEGVRWYHVDTEPYGKTLKERTYLAGWYPHSGGRHCQGSDFVFGILLYLTYYQSG